MVLYLPDPDTNKLILDFKIKITLEIRAQNIQFPTNLHQKYNTSDRDTANAQDLKPFLHLGAPAKYFNREEEIKSLKKKEKKICLKGTVGVAGSHIPPPYSSAFTLE